MHYMREFTQDEKECLMHHIRISDVFQEMELGDEVQIIWHQHNHPRVTKGKVVGIDHEMQDVIVKDDNHGASMILIGAIDDITILSKHVNLK